MRRWVPRRPARRASTNEYWLPRSRGFRVDSPVGEVGTVDQVRFGPDDRASALLVRRDFFDTELTAVPVEDVRAVLPAEKRVVIRGPRVRPAYRFASAAAFAAAAGSFLLPFLAAAVDRRRADALGIDLVRGTPSLTGTYVHAAYEGHVEALMDLGRGPAIAVLSCAVAGLFVAWLPGRAALKAGLGVAVAGLLGIVILWRATTPAPLNFAVPDYRYGMWVAAAAFLGAAAFNIWCLRRTRNPVATRSGVG